MLRSALHIPYALEKGILKPELCKLSLGFFPPFSSITSKHVSGQRGSCTLPLSRGAETFQSAFCKLIL